MERGYYTFKLLRYQIRSILFHLYKLDLYPDSNDFQFLSNDFHRKQNIGNEGEIILEAFDGGVEGWRTMGVITENEVGDSNDRPAGARRTT